MQGVWDMGRSRRCGKRGFLRLEDTTTSAPLALKLKGLGANTGDLEMLLQAMGRHVQIPAGSDVIRAGETVKRSTVLLSGMTCSYTRNEKGDRHIHSFHHAGDFCDLLRYVVPGCDGVYGVQALTDSVVVVVDYRDMDRLLGRPSLALALWRATVLDAATYRERMTNMSRGSALERVAHLLC